MRFFNARSMLVIALWPMLASAECLKDLRPLLDQARDYFRREQFFLATQPLILTSRLACDGPTRDEARLRLAQSLFSLGETGEGLLALEQIPDSSPSKTKARVVAAWYQRNLVPTLPAADQKRFDDLDEKIKALPKVKTPWVAGTLSALVPGAGQVYNGNYQSAAFSFVLNALFLASTVEFSREGLEAPALASGMVFSVTYLGNIIGSVQASRALNENAARAESQNHKTQIFPELSFF